MGLNSIAQPITVVHGFSIIGLILWNLYNDCFGDADAYITPIYVRIWGAPLNCRVQRDQFFCVVWAVLINYYNSFAEILLHVLSLQYWCDLGWLAVGHLGSELRNGWNHTCCILAPKTFGSSSPRAATESVIVIATRQELSEGFYKAFVLGLGQWEFESASSMTKGLQDYIDYTPPLPALLNVA